MTESDVTSDNANETQAKLSMAFFASRFIFMSILSANIKHSREEPRSGDGSAGAIGYILPFSSINCSAVLIA